MTAAFPLILSGVQVRRQGKTVLGPVDLTLCANGTTIIVGPNGSGKTALSDKTSLRRSGRFRSLSV